MEDSNVCSDGTELGVIPIGATDYLRVDHPWSYEVDFYLFDSITGWMHFDKQSCSWMKSVRGYMEDKFMPIPSVMIVNQQG